MHPVLFTIWGLSIRSYGFQLMLAHLVGVGMLLYLGHSKRLPLGQMLDLLLAVVVFGALGARIGYVATHGSEFPTFASLFYVWKGGFAFFGGFFFALAAFIAVVHWHKLPLLATADLVSPVLPFSLGLVRIGCFLEGCCHGSPSSQPWAVTFTRPDSWVLPALLNIPLHPTQLYEALFLFLLAAALAWGQRKKRLPTGVLGSFSILAYALYRFAGDFLRGDLERNFMGVPWLTHTQVASLVGAFGASAALLYSLRHDCIRLDIQKKKRQGEN